MKKGDMTQLMFLKGFSLFCVEDRQTGRQCYLYKELFFELRKQKKRI